MSEPTSQKRIVVIDDDPDFLDYTRIILHSAGYQVETATSADEGLALIRSVAPHLIVSDLMMSYTLEGVGLVQQVAHDPDLAHIPLCVVTSVARTLDSVEFDEETARSVKCFLTKPVSPHELLTTIGHYLSEGR